MVNDELTWRRRKEGENNWRADNHDGTAAYVVYDMGDYGTFRTCGVLLSNNDGRDLEIFVGAAGMIETAKDACQRHHNTAARAARWAAYMRDNEPPVQP